MTSETDARKGERVKELRQRLGMTQVEFAELLGVSFVTVNRWERGKSVPSARLWDDVLVHEKRCPPSGRSPQAPGQEPTSFGVLSVEGVPDFTTTPDLVRLVVEGDRLSYGHLFNPTFATEAALIDPLPHQRIAVYEHMLTQPRLRFLLADDAGAGKTIMAGLYIREMLTRRLIRRVLIAPPAGLVSNWRRELSKLLGLHFSVFTGSDARFANPFTSPASDLALVSLDTLAGECVFGRLQEESTEPYDLVVFDEAHKLSADRDPDFRIRKTERYRLAEALCGVSHDARWSARHVLLLSATPHMGKDYPYYFLWRLLEPEVLSTFDAFSEYPQTERSLHFIRRAKEEMVYYDGTAIYKERQCNTLPFELTQGTDSEQELYDATTEYIRFYYNRARILNRSAARLAMSVFQRRMASSTHALKRSLERRLEKLDKYIADMISGVLSEADWQRKQDELNRRVTDTLETKTADEEAPSDGREENEVEEDQALEAFAIPLSQLEDERARVEELLGLANRVYDKGSESKFDRLHELLRDPDFAGEKLIVFTEYRDTMDFLARRFEGLGFAGRIAQIHGGMLPKDRDEQVEFLRKPMSDGGAQVLVATDAAGEGINLQFCWLMVNYDIPWNPARLEQRMGRIHRYGQKHDPVVIANLVAPKTREGRVLKTLLEKLERIRKEMRKDKVFDVIGRLLVGVSLREYMAQALEADDSTGVVTDIDTRLSAANVSRQEEIERSLYGSGDVAPHLARLKRDLEQEVYLRLLPGFVRSFVEQAAPAVGLAIKGDLDGCFTFVPERPDALNPFLAVLDDYSADEHNCLTVRRPGKDIAAIYLRPGDALFDQLCGYVRERFRPGALKGAVFVDPNAEKPYFLHLVLVGIDRRADLEVAAFARTEPLVRRLVTLKQEPAGAIAECPVEHLLLLRGQNGVPVSARRVAVLAGDSIAAARDFAMEQIALPLAEQYRQELQRSLPGRLGFLERGYHHQEIELALARSRLRGKAEAGVSAARQELERVKVKQRRLFQLQESSASRLKREPDLVEPGSMEFLAHVLVVPSADQEERMRHDAEVESIAVAVVRAHEEGFKARVRDVSTPARARVAGLNDWPGFDLLSHRPGAEERAIEVKGRATTGAVELSGNEWAKACNLGVRYWLYVVYDCASHRPRLFRVQDPFKRLLGRAKGGVILEGDDIVRSAEVDVATSRSSKEE